jgi:hypothetical protein
MEGDEAHYATVTEIAARLEPHPKTKMLLTAVSEAVERYDPSREAVILLETASSHQVLILSPEGSEFRGRDRLQARVLDLPMLLEESLPGFARKGLPASCLAAPVFRQRRDRRQFSLPSMAAMDSAKTVLEEGRSGLQARLTCQTGPSFSPR